MSRSSRWRTLGVCLMLLSFLVVGASAAQAKKMIIWRVNGANISTAKLSPILQVQEIPGKDLVLLSKIEGKKVEVLCTAASFTGVQLEMEGLIGRNAQIRFSGCVTKIDGVTSPPCEPHVGTEKGVFLTGVLSNSFTVFEGSGIFSLAPLTGETFATISPIEEKEGKKAECVIGKKFTSISVLGSLSLTGTVKAESSTHSFSLGSSTALWLVSKTEEHKVTVDGGSFVLGLSGEHSGMGWSLAEVEGNWKVAGTTLTSKLTPALVIKELENGSETLLSKIAGVKVEKVCTGAELTGAKLETEGRFSSGAKVVFTGCIFKINGVEAPTCIPHSPGQKPGVIVTNETKGLLVLDGKEVDLGIEPASGETLVTVELGEECAVGEKVPLIGTLMLALSQAGTEEVTHLVVESALTELWLISKTEEHRVTLDGSAILALSGEHAGLKWSGTIE
jgi:hypothetical protein